MQIFLKSLQQDLAITFVYVTHDQDEALTMSDRLAVFDHGRIEQIGAPAEVYERPANAFVAGFVGVSNVVERDGKRLTVRPEKIRMTDAGSEPASGWHAETGHGSATSSTPAWSLASSSSSTAAASCRSSGRTSKPHRPRRSTPRAAQFFSSGAQSTSSSSTKRGKRKERDETASQAVPRPGACRAPRGVAGGAGSRSRQAAAAAVGRKASPTTGPGSRSPRSIQSKDEGKSHLVAWAGYADNPMGEAVRARRPAARSRPSTAAPRTRW